MAKEKIFWKQNKTQQQQRNFQYIHPDMHDIDSFNQDFKRL